MQLAILDRDGTINVDSPDCILHRDQFRPLPGSIEAIARLSKAGFLVAIATNQAAIGRGRLSVEELNAMHLRLEGLVNESGGRIDAVEYCPHRPEDGCDCRKPKPGMLLRLLNRFAVEPSQAVMIGDSERDLQSARAAKVQAIVVRSGYTPTNDFESSADFACADLAAAVDYLLSRRGV